MAGGETCTTITERWSGPELPTGDYYARTKDGRTWRVWSGGCPDKGSTGVTVYTTDGHKVCPPHR